MRPHAASYWGLLTCFAFFVCTGAQLESLNSSVVRAGNERRSSRMTPAQWITSDAQDVAKRWEKWVYLHVQSSCEEGPMPPVGALFRVLCYVMSCVECFCRCDWFHVVLPS